MAQEERAPRAIVLENVYGCLTSHEGRDFAAIASALTELGYRFGAAVIDAVHFVPQSRPRVFFIAFRGTAHPGFPDRRGSASKLASPSAHRGYRRYHGDGEAKLDLVEDLAAISAKLDLRRPHRGRADRREVARRRPYNYILSLMSPLNRKKVNDAIESGLKTVGAVYRRTRPDENGIKRQRAEVRFDDVAGCLRTPAGGSSRQIILVVQGKTVRSRLFSPREAARLMGLDEDYVLPERYNHAYHVCGDGVCVPVVRHMASARS